MRRRRAMLASTPGEPNQAFTLKLLDQHIRLITIYGSLQVAAQDAARKRHLHRAAVDGEIGTAPIDATRRIAANVAIGRSHNSDEVTFTSPFARDDAGARRLSSGDG